MVWPMEKMSNEVLNTYPYDSKDCPNRYRREIEHHVDPPEYGLVMIEDRFLME